jgi:hypothetical protein
MRKLFAAFDSFVLIVIVRLCIWLEVLKGTEKGSLPSNSSRLRDAETPGNDEVVHEKTPCFARVRLVLHYCTLL